MFESVHQLLLFLFVDVTEMFGKVYYLAKFDKGVRFFQSKSAMEQWPDLIIAFLEPLMEV